MSIAKVNIAKGAASRAPSFLAPFRHRAFAVIWTATLVSNVGWWMYSTASGWLMTSLNPDPLIVALVQAASSLPIFLFAIPAGALADIFDKRKFLLVVEFADNGGLGGLCRHCWFRPGDAGQFAAVHLPDRRRWSHDRAGLAGGRAAARSQRRSAAGDCRQQRRRERLACPWAGAWRVDHIRLRRGRAVLGQCARQSGDRRVAAVVAAAARRADAVAGRALRPSHFGRPALCPA